MNNKYSHINFKVKPNSELGNTLHYYLLSNHLLFYIDISIRFLCAFITSVDNFIITLLPRYQYVILTPETVCWRSDLITSNLRLINHLLSLSTTQHSIAHQSYYWLLMPFDSPYQEWRSCHAFQCLTIAGEKTGLYQ